MSGHERFRELCALAALGELPSAEAYGLDRHLEICKECAQAYPDYLRLHAGFVAANQGDAGLIAALEGPTKAAVLQSIVGLEPESAQLLVPKVGLQRRKAFSGAFRFVWAGALATVLCATAFWLGSRYGRIVKSGGADHIVQLQLPADAASQPTLETLMRSSGAEENQLRDALNAQTQRSMQLQAALAANQRRLSLVEQHSNELQERVADQSRELTDTQSLLASKMAELKAIEATRAGDAATLVALRYEIQDLTDRLNAQGESFKRQTDLLASGREIRDIIGARNLHIIDVYDADTRGRTKKPFARAFYTEERSLVFYAYDLPLKEKDDGEQAYVAWGQRGGKNSSIRKLGILINDDKSQKRWTFTSSDPAVLAEIDSVFITLEPVRTALRPIGKRMLTAYLDDLPNHP